MIFYLLNKIRKNQDKNIEDKPVQEIQIINRKQTHCSYCGIELEQTVGIQFCPYCGNSI